MLDLPNPRADGKCVDCRSGLAVTNDDRFCLKCLRRRVKEANPIVVTSSYEQRGRSQRNWRAVSWQSVMGSDDDSW